MAKPIVSDDLLREFRASLVSVTAAAHTIEARWGFQVSDPLQPRLDNRPQELRRAFRTAFAMSGPADERLGQDLRWLFELRDDAVHPYAESEAPKQHPAGINTGVEHSRFNAVTSGRAIDVALTILDIAALLRRYPVIGYSVGAVERSAYHDTYSC